MTGNDVNNIIDNLSAKFGVASQYLITEISRYKIARGIAFISVFLILAIICGISTYMVYKKLKKDKEAWEEKSKDENSFEHRYRFDADPYMWPLGIFTVFSFFFLILTFVNVIDVAGYIGSPTGAVISDILLQLSNK